MYNLFLKPTGAFTHDGLPLYYPSSLSIFDPPEYYYVAVIDGIWFQYDEDKQIYLTTGDKRRPSKADLPDGFDPITGMFE